MLISIPQVNVSTSSMIRIYKLLFVVCFGATWITLVSALSSYFWWFSGTIWGWLGIETQVNHVQGKFLMQEPKIERFFSKETFTHFETLINRRECKSPMKRQILVLCKINVLKIIYCFPECEGQDRWHRGKQTSFLCLTILLQQSRVASAS